ncbi:MAG TPA: hypothetical protein VH143_11970 [Kofleriaceae bacterium]|nr:hypothetical protein [Kofleriaceae bacterium]
MTVVVVGVAVIFKVPDIVVVSVDGIAIDGIVTVAFAVEVPFIVTLTMLLSNATGHSLIAAPVESVTVAARVTRPLKPSLPVTVTFAATIDIS